MSPESQAQRNVLEENATAHAKYEADTAARLDGDTNRQATAAANLSTNSEPTNAVTPRKTARSTTKTTAKKTAARKK